MQNLDEFVKELNRVKEGEKFPVVLVGNKLDLASRRQVDKKTLEDFAKEHLHSCPVFEASAKENIGMIYFDSNMVGIENIFVQTVREMRLLKNPPTSPEEGKQKKSGSLFKKLKDYVNKNKSDKK